MEKGKRKQLVSFISMMSMAFIGFMVFGLMINWNLFVVIACFIPILIVGIAIIFAPDKLKESHKELSKKIDKKITDYGKEISKATKS